MVKKKAPSVRFIKKQTVNVKEPDELYTIGYSAPEEEQGTEKTELYTIGYSAPEKEQSISDLEEKELTMRTAEEHGIDHEERVYIQNNQIVNNDTVRQETSKHFSVKKKDNSSCDSLTEEKGSTQIKHVDYLVYSELLMRHTFKCCKGQIYLYNEITGSFEELTDNDLKILIRSNWESTVEQLLTKSKVDDIIDRLKSCKQIQVNDAEFDNFINLINFRDCVLNVSTGTIFTHSPDFCFRSFINANYRSNHSKGKTFLSFIKQCTKGDSQQERLLQEIMGYVISNYTNAKKWFAFIGKPHTGKSTLLDIIKEIVGDKFTSAVPLHNLHERFMKAELYGKKLNISGEMNDGELKEINILKSITGNDDIVVEKKGKDPFVFKSKAKLIFAGNQMPTLQKLDSTTAFMDRIVFVVFNNTIPENERDYKLKEKIMFEKDFIVDWAIDGLNRLVANNFIFTECEESIKFRCEYNKEMNTVADFVKIMCLLDEHDESIRVLKRDLYQEYLNYCKDNCSDPMRKKEFFNEVNKLPITQKKIRYRKSTPLDGFIGLALKSHLDYQDEKS